MLRLHPPIQTIVLDADTVQARHGLSTPPLTYVMGSARRRVLEDAPCCCSWAFLSLRLKFFHQLARSLFCCWLSLGPVWVGNGFGPAAAAWPVEGGPDIMASAWRGAY
jgi:hypothetical protein